MATDWKPIGRVLPDRSDGLPSSRSGTGQICPLGVERPSNITQPFDLSTPTRPFANCDGWLFVQVSWFIESCKHLFPLRPLSSPASCRFLIKSGLPAHMFIFSYQLASHQKILWHYVRRTNAGLQMDMVIVTEAPSLSLWRLFTGVIFHFFNIHVPECVLNGFLGAIGSNAFCVKVLFPKCSGKLPWRGNLSIRGMRGSISVLVLTQTQNSDSITLVVSTQKL